MPRYVLTVLLALAAPAYALDCGGVEQEALQWIDRMSRSLSTVSYQGVFTYEHGSTMQALRISHSVDGNMESEQVTQLSGNHASIVRVAHPLDCVHPGHKILRMGSNFDTGDGGCGLARYYRLKMSGEKRVAGRGAVVLQVLPRDMYRYGYELALDRDTGLLLKSQTMARDGKILERFQFADLSIGPVEVAGTRVDVVHHAGHPAAESHVDIEAPARAGEPRDWSVDWVPDGFALAASLAGAGHEQTYTDGLAVFSVFLEPATPALEPGEGRARQGGTTAYTRGMHLAGQPVLVTVVGEVPVNTARIVADSVRWSDSGAD